MRRLPIFATLLVAAAIATMIGLGIWQLQRAGFKERVIASYRAAASLPPLDLDPLLERGDSLADIAFRTAILSCRSDGEVSDLRGGRSRNGQGGYSYLVACRPGASGAAGRLLVNAGWSPLPDGDLRIPLGGRISGTIGAVEAGRPIILTADQAVAPLVPSAPPSLDTIPNNHLGYAIQWFLFAAAALAIYVVALRRRGRDIAEPGPNI